MHDLAMFCLDWLIILAAIVGTLFLVAFCTSILSALLDK